MMNREDREFWNKIAVTFVLAIVLALLAVGGSEIAGRAYAATTTDGSRTFVDRLEVTMPFDVAVSKGALPGVQTVNLAGDNADMDTAGAEDLWTMGGSYSFIDTTSTLYVSSACSTSTLPVKVTGLDENGRLQSVTVETTGTTAVFLTETPNEILESDDFATTTGWDTGTSWTISGGAIAWAGGPGGASFSQTVNLMSNRQMRLSYTISALTSSSLAVAVGDDFWIEDTTGTFTREFTTAYQGSHILSVTASETTSTLAATLDDFSLTDYTDQYWTRVLSAVNTGADILAGDAYVFTSGTLSNGVPASAATIKAHLDMPDGVSRMAIYTVPAGYRGVLSSVGATSLTGGATYTLWKREFGGGWTVADRLYFPVGSSARVYNPALYFPARCDIRLSGVSSADNTKASVQLGLILIKD
jgi:hypothetical protein